MIDGEADDQLLMPRADRDGAGAPFLPMADALTDARKANGQLVRHLGMRGEFRGAALVISGGAAYAT
jgi:hypothetical protein